MSIDKDSYILELKEENNRLKYRLSTREEELQMVLRLWNKVTKKVEISDRLGKLYIKTLWKLQKEYKESYVLDMCRCEFIAIMQDAGFINIEKVIKRYDKIRDELKEISLKTLDERISRKLAAKEKRENESRKTQQIVSGSDLVQHSDVQQAST